MTSAHCTISVDNENVRVSTWTFDARGDSTGAHRHEWDYIVVPVSGGDLTATSPDGATTALTQQAGVPYRGVAGTEHTVSSSSEHPVVFTEIELKQT